MKNAVFEYLGWIGTALVLTGYYFNANLNPSSWILWIVGNFFIGLYCFKKEAHPTAIMSFILVLMSIYGYVNWMAK